ncbi:unnamed protein product [Mytilus coruscus]|uniref:Retropepsins domain-containing protein n=1 Tax=Mytilus coruscus TaxID=42192 RepID=A0A6J8CBW3_MYTCO|nr:unnamed protein product [Mytilus coruscus]
MFDVSSMSSSCKLFLRKMSRIHLNDTLIDRLVCGLKSEQTQKKLLSIQALTLEKAMLISLAMETATKDALELQGKQLESAVHKVKSQKPKQKGHIQAACRSKIEKRNAHSQNADDSQDDEVGIYAYKDKQGENNDVEIFTVNSKKKEITIDVKIYLKSVKMEVDTGSALSIIPKKEFDQMFPNRKLDSTDVILRTFSGEKFVPLVVTTVNVNYNDQSEILSLYVVQKGGGILFGRDWLRKIRLNWSKINKVMLKMLIRKQNNCLINMHLYLVTTSVA